MWQDLRALPRLRTLAESDDAPKLRVAALHALASLRDGKALALFSLAAKDKDEDLRIAGLDGLLAIHDPSASKTLVESLVDDKTRALAVSRARRLDSPMVAKALAVTLDGASRSQASEILIALSAQSSPEAAQLLTGKLQDPEVGGEAAFALARGRAALLENELRVLARKGGALRRLVVRLLFLHSARNGRALLYDELASALATSRDGADRALSVFLESAMTRSSTVDEDPAAFLARYRAEKNEDLKALMMAFLPDETRVSLPRALLEERERKGGLDREAVALALAAVRPLEDTFRRIASPEDTAIRAALARGVRWNTDPHAVGFLAERYRAEPDVVVRRALFTALLSRTDPVPIRTSTLEWALRFDPDPGIRGYARGAGSALADDADVYWIEAKTGSGAPAQGIVLLPDGRSRPFIADADGFVLLPRVPFEGSRVILTPRASYDEAERSKESR